MAIASDSDKCCIGARDGRDDLRFWIQWSGICCWLDRRLCFASIHGRPDTKYRHYSSRLIATGIFHVIWDSLVRSLRFCLICILCRAVRRNRTNVQMDTWIELYMGIIIGSSVVLLYTLISGMIGATKNMQIQYVIIVVSFLIPTFVMAFRFDYFWLIPQIGYGAAVTDIVQGIWHQRLQEVKPFLMHTGMILLLFRVPKFRQCPGILRQAHLSFSGSLFVSPLWLVQPDCLT